MSKKVIHKDRKKKIKKKLNKKEQIKTNKKKPFKKAADKVNKIIDRGGEQLVKNKVKVWPVENKYSVRFPENRHPGLRGKKDVAICFSGGGTRAASCALGQMRILQKHGLDKKAKYISCISGGSWFAVPFTYLKGMTDKKFLGDYISPGKLNNRALKDSGVFAKLIANSKFLTPFNAKNIFLDGKIRKLTPGKNDKIDENWGIALGVTFLKKLGLYEKKKQRFLAYQLSDRDTLLQRNSHLEKDDFHCVVKKDRPYLIVGGTAVNWYGAQGCSVWQAFSTKQNKIKKNDAPFYFWEFTPMYSGTPVTHTLKTMLGTRKIGGGYIENTGMDTRAPVGKLKSLVLKVRTRKNLNRFSLQDTMAISGAAPAFITLIGRIGVPGIKTLFPHLSAKPLSKVLFVFIDGITHMFPEINSWPILKGKNISDNVYPFMDGGYQDNWGIISPLRRKVKTMFVFINTSVPLEGDYTSSIKIDDYFHVLFGKNDLVESVISKLSISRGHLFKNTNKKKTGFDNWNTTMEGLLAARDSGGPVYYRGKYITKKNDFHGITEGHVVDIVWFYNNKSVKWESQLHQEAKRKLGIGRKINWQKPDEEYKGEFKNFPGYSTFLPKGRDKDKKFIKGLIDSAEPVDLSEEQVAFLSNFSAWCLQTAIDDNVLNNLRGL